MKSFRYYRQDSRQSLKPKWYYGEPISKITRPKLIKVHQRERIFRLQDDAHQYRAIWISSPVGAGKTTLVASYLESRGIDGLWYQIVA